MPFMEHTESLSPTNARLFSSAQIQRRCRSATGIFFLLMIAIGSIPGKADALSAATNDKFLHFCAYSTLSVLLYLGLGGSTLRRVLGTLLVIALLGLTDETIQYFLPYRNSNTLDWLFNMMAAALSVTLCSAFQHTRTGRRTHIPEGKQVRRENE